MGIVSTILETNKIAKALMKDIKEIKEKVEKLERLADEQEQRRIEQEWDSTPMMGEYRRKR